MIFWQLILSFIKIGLTSFSGLTMIPLVQDEVIKHGWMTAEEVLDLVAIAEATPGPVGLNVSTFAGMRAAGPLGAIAAGIGILVPGFTVALIVAAFFKQFRSSHFMDGVLLGIRPGTVGLTLGYIITLCKTTYWSIESGFRIYPLLISVLCGFCLLKWKMRPVTTMFIAGGLGLLGAAVRYFML